MGLESLGKKLAQFGQDTKNSVAKMSETYQINSRISDEKRSLNTLLTQIGSAVVEKYADAPLEGLEDQFEAVRKARENIAALEAQAQKLKGIRICPECGKEAAKGERFCSACGAKLPEEEDPAEKLRQDAREAGSEVGDMVNDAADKARDFFNDVADKAGAFVDGLNSRVNPDQEKDTTEETAAEDQTQDETVKEDTAKETAAEASGEETSQEAAAETSGEETVREGAAEAAQETAQESQTDGTVTEEAAEEDQPQEAPTSEVS